MQPVDFRNINDFLDYLPEEHLMIVGSLREIILSCIPDAREHLSFNVPYYSRFTRICFIWPSSVPWGNVKLRGVDLGFCRGNLLSDPSYLDMGNRKQVYIKNFTDVRQIDHETIRQLLFEAVVIDEECAMAKKSARKRGHSGGVI